MIPRSVGVWEGSMLGGGRGRVVAALALASLVVLLGLGGLTFAADQTGTKNSDRLDRTHQADNIKGDSGDDTINGDARGDGPDGGGGSDKNDGGAGGDAGRGARSNPRQ